jgi:hypothetical protein
MRRTVLAFALQAAIVAGIVGSAASVQACPMCKLANEEGQIGDEQNLRPRAYMYSILFMLSMPATLTAGFSFAFYRAWKKGKDALDVPSMDESLKTD